MRSYHEEAGGGRRTDRTVVKCFPQQGRDGYKRVDIISSDTHCVADSLQKHGPGSIVGIDLVNRAQSLDTLLLLTVASNQKFEQNSVGDLIKTQKGND